MEEEYRKSADGGQLSDCRQRSYKNGQSLKAALGGNPVLPAGGNAPSPQGSECFGEVKASGKWLSAVRGTPSGVLGVSPSARLLTAPRASCAVSTTLLRFCPPCLRRQGSRNPPNRPRSVPPHGELVDFVACTQRHCLKLPVRVLKPPRHHHKGPEILLTNMVFAHKEATVASTPRSMIVADACS